MTYGQIAALLGDGHTARTVGYALRSLDDAGKPAGAVPWHRVINSQGRISTGRITLPIDLQQSMLESEGIEFDAKGRCRLEEVRWEPDKKVLPK